MLMLRFSSVKFWFIKIPADLYVVDQDNIGLKKLLGPPWFTEMRVLGRAILSAKIARSTAYSWSSWQESKSQVV